METNNPPTSTPTAATTAKLTNPIYQSSIFVCSCNRVLSNLEYVKVGGKWTGVVICKCPGGAACPNGNRKIKVTSQVVEAEETV